MTSIVKLLLPFLVPFLSCTNIETGRALPVETSIAPAATMTAARSGHTATLLPNGKVIITGGMNGNGTYYDSIEIFDPIANRFTSARSMSANRVGHTATLLRDGRVLLAGGFNGDYLQGAEIYDPATGSLTATGQLTEPRSSHLAIQLTNGKVLLIGGVGTGYSFLASAEIYDPASGKFTGTGRMTTPREGHTATLLKNGKVLVAGGHKDRRDAMTVFSSAELYDPATGRFTATGDMTIIRHKHGAVLLADGNVLIAGGSDKRDSRGQYSSAEIYDAARGVFRSAGNMNSTRYKLSEATVLLKDGRAVIAGGSRRVEIYNPVTNSFSDVGGELDAARFFSSATLLKDGRVLIAGGYDDRGTATAKAWVYNGGA